MRRPNDQTKKAGCQAGKDEMLQLWRKRTSRQGVPAQDKEGQSRGAPIGWHDVGSLLRYFNRGATSQIL